MPAWLDGHLRHLDLAVPVAQQRDRAERLVSVIDGEQDAAAGCDDVGLRIAQHFTVDGFHREPALQPFDVETGEVLAPARLEIHHTHCTHDHDRRCPGTVSRLPAHDPIMNPTTAESLSGHLLGVFLNRRAHCRRVSRPRQND